MVLFHGATFLLIYVPLCVDDGYWRGGRFLFEITVPSNYNIVVSIATAVIKIHIHIKGCEVRLMIS